MKMSFVYVKTMTGHIIPFESLGDPIKIYNLRSEYAEYLKQNDYENDIDLGRIVFFNENFEKLYAGDGVVNGNTYHVLISDPIVRVSFDGIIFFHHDYEKLPRKAHLEIDFGKNDDHIYIDIYNKINYSCIDDEDSEDFDDNFEEEQKFRNILEEYYLDHLFEDNFDFKDLSEKDKINLIKAYLRFYLCVNMEIETYKIHY